MIANNIQILINRISGSLIPLSFVDALLGKQELYKLAEFAPQEAPASLDMLDQGVRLILG